MPDGKDHICTGPKCIYCQIAADEKLANQASSLAIVNEQALLRVKSSQSKSPIVQYESHSTKTSQFEQWEKIAFCDPLTGLSNIHVFLQELKYEVSRAGRYKRPLTIAILRIDKYEDLKGSYGPLGCEFALKHIAKIALDSLREVDLAARLQMDQFGFILPETNQAGGNIVAERIRERLLKNPIKQNAFNLDLTCSIGISSFPKHGTDADSLLENCLTAQAEATAKGGNRVFAL